MPDKPREHLQPEGGLEPRREAGQEIISRPKRPEPEADISGRLAELARRGALPEKPPISPREPVEGFSERKTDETLEKGKAGIREELFRDPYKREISASSLEAALPGPNELER